MKQPKWFIQFIAILFAGYFSIATVHAFGSLQELGASLLGNEPELLQADKAFAFSYETDGQGQLILSWEIAPEYYLYQDKFAIKVIEGSATIGHLRLPPATEKMDPVFNKYVQAYYDSFSAPVSITNLSDTVKLQITFQGCANVGVCYPPMHKIVKLYADTFGIYNPSEATTSLNKTIEPAIQESQVLSETDKITEVLINSNIWIIAASFFLIGLLLAFTPCVFPMIPILSSIIISQGDKISTKKAFTLSLVYVLAMAATYTTAGVLAGMFGANLQVLFQNPWVISGFILVFIALAFSMFGFFELQLPNSLQNKIMKLSNKQEGGTLIGVAIMGVLSALIIGPCMAPPLAGALIYIGQTGDALLGGIALFAMSIGMGIPLLLLGASAGKILPRAGAWMDNIKAIFGVSMIAIAIWMADRILPESIVLLAWAGLLIGSAVYLGALEPIGNKSDWHKLFKSLGILLLAAGLMVLLGLAGGSKSLLQPLKVFQSGGYTATQSEDLVFKPIKTFEDLQAEIKNNPKVMLDFYADWCVSCKEMEIRTFSDSGVHDALEGVVLLKADVTANDDADKALMKALGVVGPPSILFFQDGIETRSQRVVGFQNAEDFIININKSFNP